MPEETAEVAVRQRSPNYPSISLRAAVVLLQKLYAEEKRWALPDSIVCKHGGYSGTQSGPAKRLLSALGKFGLLEFKNSLQQFTETGKRVALLPETDPERRTLLADAAKRYEEIAASVSKFPDGFPDEAALIRYLMLERGFSDAGARQFAPILLETVEYAGLIGPANEESLRPATTSTALTAPSPSPLIAPAPMPASESNRTLNAGTAEGAVGELHVWQLGRGVTVRLSSNVKLTPKHYELLEKYVGIAKQSAALADDSES